MRSRNYSLRAVMLIMVTRFDIDPCMTIVVRLYEILFIRGNGNGFKKEQGMVG